MSLSPSIPGKILIVDGDDSQRSAFQTVLSDRFFETQVAANGQEALERLDAFNADVIVTDFGVPPVEGIQLLQRLKERGDITPAIVLAGVGSMHKALPLAEELKAFWLLEKPVEPRAFELRASIDEPKRMFGVLLKRRRATVSRAKTPTPSSRPSRVGCAPCRRGS